ncbi:MAG: hypothetical protein JWR44_2485 [Hymenobacter sp.]|jgi:hypothetical protein|nr:hypothetical protein [Hymenobacter sp.]
MNTATVPASEGRTILYHRRHAKQQAVKTVGHLVPAVVLLLGVAPILAGDEPLTFMAGLEVAVGIAYLVLMVRELLQLRHNPFHRERVAWLEMASAGILALEGYHIWHRHHVAELAGGPHKVHALPWVYGAVALAYVVLAFRLNKLAERSYLHLHADGFAVRIHRLGRAHTLRWADIGAVEPAGTADLLIHHADGQTHRVSFANLHEGAHHRDQLLAHVAQHQPARPEAG